MKACLISLGCPKNLVDSEEILGALKSAGWELSVSPDDADAVLVNTCGFIKDAKEESAQAILEALNLKAEGKCRAVAAVGCLAQRYGDFLREELPELDAIIGVNRSGRLPEILEAVLSGEKVDSFEKQPASWLEHPKRVLSTPPWAAYLKISDGCDNRCAYCAIPEIRGSYRSRPLDYILQDARRLSENGVKEITLVAQDSTRYGEDLKPAATTAVLLRELCRNTNESIRWIRLMYAYPTGISDDLIEVIISEKKICKYLDIPIQHAHPTILKRMNRRGNPAEYRKTIQKLRVACPDIAIRTTLMVGFPGETEKEFEDLLRFVEEIEFDRLGAFVYSPEDGTPAEHFKPRVNRKTAEKRYERLMETQQAISLRKNRSFIGKQLEILIEGRDEIGAFGRSYRDAPEIDGIVRIENYSGSAGNLIKAIIIGASEYDLLAKPL